MRINLFNRTISDSFRLGFATPLHQVPVDSGTLFVELFNLFHDSFFVVRL